MPRARCSRPLRHMSHSPTAQAGARHGGPGRRTMPTTRSPGATSLSAGAVSTVPSELMAEDEAPLPGRRGAVGTTEDFAICRTYPERARAHQDGDVRQRRYGHLVEPGGIRDSGQNRDLRPSAMPIS